MSSLTFYGGVNEIGGNKIWLRDKDVNVWFDFGQSFTYGEKYFVDWLSPRKIVGCKDYFEFGLLPKILGLYQKVMLEETDLEYVEPRFDGVFLTHAHFDHIAHISFLDKKIPIYLGEATNMFIKSQETTTSGANYGEHPFQTFKTGTKVKIGHLEVEPIHVDHSIPAAYGYIIHTSKGVAAYTGDLRLHGPKAKMTQEFIERLKQERPVCMITEGTRVAPTEKRKNLSEQQVSNGVYQITKNSKNLVLASSYGRDIDRFKTFYDASIKTDRKFVITPKIAHLMNKLANHMKVPDVLSDKRIYVYFKRKKSGTYDDNDYYVWERPFLNRIVTPDEIHKKQSKYLVHLSFYDFAEMIDIKPNAGSVFIYSMSEPFTEEDINYTVMQNWIRHFNLLFHQLHASGHASKEEIANIINTIKPKKVIPIHTEYPNLFKTIAGKNDVELPIIGSILQI